MIWLHSQRRQPAGQPAAGLGDRQPKPVAHGIKCFHGNVRIQSIAAGLHDRAAKPLPGDEPFGVETRTELLVDGTALDSPQKAIQAASLSGV